MSPRSASSATAALNWSEKFRRFVILVSIRSGWIHLSTLSEFAGPLQFELRLGQKQLRGKFEMNTWQDLRDTLGDAYNDALGRLRYCIPNSDSNRARWPAHELWHLFDVNIRNDLAVHCCGVLPNQVIFANKTAKMCELDRQLLGLFVSRAAISEVSPEAFNGFMESHVDALQRYSKEHPKTLDERLQKAAGRYRWT